MCAFGSLNHTIICEFRCEGPCPQLALIGESSLAVTGWAGRQRWEFTIPRKGQRRRNRRFGHEEGIPDKSGISEGSVC